MLKLYTRTTVEQPAATPIADEKPRPVRLAIEELEARIAPSTASGGTGWTMGGGWALGGDWQSSSGWALGGAWALGGFGAGGS